MTNDESASPDRAGNEETLIPEAARIAELEARLKHREEALASTNARLHESAQAAAATEARLQETSECLARTVAGYRELACQANPEIPEDLVSGDSIEAIARSLEQGKSLITRVKQGLAAEVQAARIPAGAPPRTGPDLTALSPREKILYSIRR